MTYLELRVGEPASLLAGELAASPPLAVPAARLSGENRVNDGAPRDGSTALAAAALASSTAHRLLASCGCTGRRVHSSNTVATVGTAAWERY